MLQKSSLWKTLEVFFRSPAKEHYLMGISRRIGLAHTSVKRNLGQLAHAGLIEEVKERRGSRTFPLFRAKPDGKEFKQLKKIYNLFSLLDSGLVAFVDDALAPKSVVVFGSYQRGEDTEESDIDLFVECKQAELNLAQFEKKLGRKIELHFNEDFTFYPKELKNNLINGMVVAGFLEGYK